jgi:hypothetical protein
VTGLDSLPSEGLPFFHTSREGVVLDRTGRNHFDLLATHLGFDLEQDGALEEFVNAYEGWFRSERPRLGRVGNRGGRLDLVTLTMPLVHSPAGSEIGEQERDVQIAARILAEVAASLAVSSPPRGVPNADL